MEITGGNITLQELWLPSRNSTEPVPLVKATLDLCDFLVDFIGKNCPVAKGVYQAVYKDKATESFPKVTTIHSINYNL